MNTHLKSNKSLRARILAILLALVMVLAVFGSQIQMVRGAEEDSLPAVAQEDSSDEPEGTDPAQEETDPEQGETDPEQGETDPEQGETDPEQGETDPEQGETDPEQGETDPEQGETDPEEDGDPAEEEAEEVAVPALDISPYLNTTTSYLYVKAMDGKEHLLTATAQTGFVVDAQAEVRVGLYFQSISGIAEKQTLVYAISDDVLTFAEGMQGGDMTFEGAHVGTYEFVYDDAAKATNIVFTIDTDYFNTYRQNDGTMTLHNLFVEFYASLSKEHGEDSAKENDKTITLSGNGDLKFEVPFAYKNENGKVTVTKDSTYDPSTRTIHYTVTVTAPADNTLTAENVAVKDVLDTADAAYIVADDSGSYYREVTPAEGTTYDADTNVWTVGDMAIGTSKTLEYDMVVSDKFFANTENNSAIDNTVTATFNDSGSATDTNSQPCAGTVLIDKSSSAVQSDDKGTYVLYTLEVTAYGSTVDNVVVKDAFDFDHVDYSWMDSNEQYEYEDSIESMEAVTKSDSTDTVTIHGTSGLTWEVGTLEQDTSATMQYKVYLNEEAWNQQNQVSSDPAKTRIRLHNIAQVGVENPENPDELIAYDQDVDKKDIDKVWLNKSYIALNGDGNYQFTVTVNGDPVQEGVTTITDTLTNGTYTSDVTLYRYRSSTDTAAIDSYTIAIDQSQASFTIDLTNVNGKDISGAYYYKLVYTATATGISGTNNVSIGGDGINYQTSKTVTGIAGFTWKTDYKKEVTGVDYEKGDSTWKITVYKDIPAQAKMTDRLGRSGNNWSAYANGSGTYKYGLWWFTQDDIDNIVVKVGGVELDKSQYTITPVNNYKVSDEKEYKVDSKSYYSEFDIVFTNGVTGVSKSNPVTIEYNVHIDYEANDQFLGTDANSGEYLNEDYNNYSTNGTANWTLWWFKEGDDYTLVTPYDKEAYVSLTLAKNVPLLKKAGVYNAADGTVTWDIEVNRFSSLSGSGTLIDDLPEGFTFVSAEITSLPKETQDRTYSGVKYVLTNETPSLGNITTEDVTENGKTFTRVTIPVENLSSYSYNRYLKNGTVTANTGNDFLYGLVAGNDKDGDWMRLGRFTVTVTAKVSGSVLNAFESSGKESLTYTNTAKLSMDNDSLGGKTVSAAGDVSITKAELLTKEMTYTSGSHAKYTLEVNPTGIDLISGPDVVTIVDQIYSGVTAEGNGSYDSNLQVKDTTVTKDTDQSIASLETTKKNYLVVYEVGDDGSLTDITADCTLVNTTEEDGKFTLTVPDDKHLRIEYWVAFSGFVGDTVSLSNQAYFEYSADSKENSTPVESNQSFQVKSSRAGGNAGPSFGLLKVDQWENPVAGVTFDLYQVELDSDGTPIMENGALKMTKVQSLTTVSGDTTIKDSDGNEIAITEGMVDFEDLSYNGIYCYKEVSAPYGYVMDTALNFVEFKSHEAADEVLRTYGTVHAIADHDAVLTVTNTLVGTSYALPMVKTINGATPQTSLQFTFTLKQTGDNQETVYTDETFETPLAATGLTATVGTGSVSFDTLYFKKAGTYTFTLTENDFTAAGYSKDQSSYLVTIVVGADSSNRLVVTSATYQKTKDNSGSTVTDGTAAAIDAANSAVPTFNNLYALSPTTLTFHGKKVLEGNRATGVQAGEFQFVITENGETVATGTTTEDGAIVFDTISITEDDMGTHTYVIAEVAGEDRTITYTTETATVVVTVSDDGNGGVKAEITSCETTLAVDDDGVITFVNTYTKPKQIEPSNTVKPEENTEEPEEDTSSAPEEEDGSTPETPVAAPGSSDDLEEDSDEEEAETSKQNVAETEPSDSESSDAEEAEAEEAALSQSDDKEDDSTEATADFESEQITTEKAEAVSNPTTGDSSHVILWVISAGVSVVVAGALLMVIVMMRKRA